MGSDRHESARWSVETGQLAGEFMEAREKVLTDAAARGFEAPPGESLAMLFEAGMKVKGKLAEINGKLYEEERGRIFEAIEFNLKKIVLAAKLAMEWYRAELLNAISLEQGELEATKEHHRGDIERMTAETEIRQAGIIRAKADAEHEANGYRLALIAAERESLWIEMMLVQAKLETARARLAIIDSIYAVIEAENQILVAEKQRVAALEIVLAAKKELAAVKEAMIPFYQQKADAQTQLSVAIKQDAETRKQIEELGHQKNALKLAESAADSAVRQSELSYQMANEQYIRAEAAAELARAQARTAVQLAANEARGQVVSLHNSAEGTKLATRINAMLTRHTTESSAEVTLNNFRANLENSTIGNLINNINNVAIAREKAIAASGNETIHTNSETVEALTIVKV